MKPKEMKGMEMVYRVKTERRMYHVVLRKLKNGVNGNPKYEATIVFTSTNNCDWEFHRTFKFDGHYYSDYEETKWIVNYMEKEVE